MKIQLENENKRPSKNCTEKSIGWPKLKNGGFKKMRIQLEKKNSIRKFKWKFNLKMEIKVYLEIGKKVYEDNKNWEVTKIDKCG